MSANVQPEDPSDDSFAIPSHSRKRRVKRGWYAAKRASGNWTGYAWDKVALKYQGRTFSTETEALDWAERKNAEFKLGQAKAGRSSLQRIADEYLLDCDLHGSSEGHKVYVKYVVRTAIAGGITDLNNTEQVVVATRKVLTGLLWKGVEGKPATAGAKNSFLKILRRIGSFAMRHRHLLSNPFQLLDKVPVKKPLKGVFTLEELGRLVDPQHKGHPFYPVFAAMIYTGFRCNEVKHLAWEWFLWDSMRLAMQIDLLSPKGQHERRARVTRLMEEFDAVMRPRAGVTGLVFPELRELSNWDFQARFESYLAHCGVPALTPASSKKRTPHSTRHTWTCLMLASGENEILVQHYAGHSQKEMTSYYARQQDVFRRQVEKAAWPKGELRLRDFVSVPKAVSGVS